MKNNRVPVSSVRECWVPLCKGPINNEQKMISLPRDPQSREVWLALAGKSLIITGQQIYFCSNHFSPDEILGIGQCDAVEKLPLKNIPGKICHLCLSIIDSDDSGSDSVNVLSKNISTEMPACIEEMLPYYSPSKPESLHKIVSHCIPGLDIQSNPPPLVCNSCFVNVWLFYIYKVSALEVEETFKADIPVENYSKMVLCRSCPIRSGTNFMHVEEDSSKGQLLKKIFGGSSTEKDPLPLRLCKVCYEVVTRLDLFYQSCQTAQKKMNSHIAMERKLAERRNKLDNFIKMSQNRKQDISTFFEDSCKNREAECQGEIKLSKNVTSTGDKNEKKSIVSSLEGELKRFCKSKGANPNMFYKILQQISNSENSEYCAAVLNRWHLVKRTALTNKKEGKLTEMDKMILSLLEYGQREDDKNEASNSTDGLGSSKSDSSDPNSTDGTNSSKSDSSVTETLPVVHSTFKSHFSGASEVEHSDENMNTKAKKDKKPGLKISQMKLLKAIESEFNRIQKEKTLVTNPIEEIFARLLKTEYSNYPLSDIKRTWSNMGILARCHKRTYLRDQDKLIIDIKRKVKEYKRNRMLLLYPSYFKISSAKRENKSNEPTDSNSDEVTNSTGLKNFNNSSKSNQIPTNKTQWKQEDYVELFKLIEQEYNEILQKKGTVPIRCWKIILSAIAKKKEFKSCNETELYILWQKIRKSAFLHERKGKMTTLDKKIINLLESHKKIENQKYVVISSESQNRKQKSFSDGGNETTSTNSSVPAKRVKTNEDQVRCKDIDSNNQEQPDARAKDSVEKSQLIGEDVIDETTVNSSNNTMEDQEEDIDSDATEIDDDKTPLYYNQHISWKELSTSVITVLKRLDRKT